MLQNIEVDYYGAATPLPQIASISSPDAQTLMINVYDKSAMQAVEKAISDSDLGFTPNNNGEVCGAIARDPGGGLDLLACLSRPACLPARLLAH